VDPLHDDHDASGLLVTRSGDQRRAVPFNYALPAHIRQGVARLERIVNDNEIAAPSGHVPPIEVA